MSGLVDTKRSRGCHQQDDLSGDPLDEELTEVVSFINSNQKKAECISLDDLKSMLKAAPEIYLWKPRNPADPKHGIPLKYAPVFKMPYSGIFVQASAVFLRTFACYQLESIGKHLIGSRFGVSQLHGAEEELFAARPIHKYEFDAFIMHGTAIPSKDRTKGPFVPYRFEKSVKIGS